MWLRLRLSLGLLTRLVIRADFQPFCQLSLLAFYFKGQPLNQLKVALL